MGRSYLLTLSAVLLGSCPALAADILVPADFPTIQQAINAAANFDTIRVSPGVYPELLNFNGKAITLQSVDPSNPAVVASTILQGSYDPQVGVFPQNEETAITITNVTAGPAVVRGLTIQDFGDELGYVTGINASGNLQLIISECRFLRNVSIGGAATAIRAVGPVTIAACFFQDNDASGGSSAVELLGGLAQVSACTFVSNIGSEGGGINFAAGSVGTVFGCTFTGNDAGRGGGLAALAGSNVSVLDSTFSNNIVNGGSGGAAAVVNGSLSFSRCQFIGNQAVGGSGGALLGDGSGSLTVSRCTLRNNVASGGNGGAITLRGGAVGILRECALSGNSTPGGSGLAITLQNTSNLTLERSTVAGNVGTSAALRLDNTSVLNAVNSIVFNHTTTLAKAATASANFTYSNVQGGQPGIGNLNQNPLFVDLANGDLSLAVGSPSIDAGDPAAVVGGKDLGGDSRLLDGNLDGSLRLDQGADEFAPLRLTVTGTLAAGQTVTIATQPVGASFIAGALVVGVQPSEFLIFPLGTVFSNPLTATVLSWPTPPASVNFTAGPTLPAGVFVSLQAIAVNFTGWTISAPVELTSS